MGITCQVARVPMSQGSIAQRAINRCAVLRSLNARAIVSGAQNFPAKVAAKTRGLGATYRVADITGETAI